MLARAVACIISYQSAKRNCKHAMSWLCCQLSHEVAKKAIKAALKLCMYVFVIYESHL